MPAFTQPRRIEIVLVDDDGTQRSAVATRPYGRNANLPHWDMRLMHPSGEHWPASFDGNAVLDALGELIERKEHRYNESRSRGHRAQGMLADRNVPIDDSGAFTRANITDTKGRQVAFGRAAAAAARARSGGSDG